MRRNYENVSGGTCMINTISIKDRLKNQTKENRRTMQDELVTYGLERTIEQNKEFNQQWDKDRKDWI